MRNDFTPEDYQKILNTEITISCFNVDKETYSYKKEMIDNQINNLEAERKMALSDIKESLDRFIKLLPANYIPVRLYEKEENINESV
jgi:hypothetical protein